MSENKEKINMTDTYTTTDGRKVRIDAIDGGGTYPVHGAIFEENKWTSYTWTLDGKFNVVLSDPRTLTKVSPYADWPIDAKVWVWESKNNSKLPRHFAGINSDGRAMAWPSGRTSFTSDELPCAWDHAELAE